MNTEIKIGKKPLSLNLQYVKDLDGTILQIKHLIFLRLKISQKIQQFTD